MVAVVVALGDVSRSSVAGRVGTEPVLPDYRVASGAG
jgi:hypothetical protein